MITQNIPFDFLYTGNPLMSTLAESKDPDGMPHKVAYTSC